MNDNFDENENIDEEEQYDEYAELDRLAEQAEQIGDAELRDEFVRLKKREKKTALFFGIGMIVMFVLVIVMIVLTVVRIRYAKSLQDRLDSMTAPEETEKDFEDVLKTTSSPHISFFTATSQRQPTRCIIPFSNP